MKTGISKYIFFWGMLAVCGAVIHSCKKDLNQSPIGSLDSTQVANKNGVDALLVGAYSLLDGQGLVVGEAGSAASNWVYGSICGTEGYKGSYVGDVEEVTEFETFVATATNDFLEAKWQAVYEGVQSANDVLRLMRRATDMNSADTTEARAEALFLRAFYHFEAKKMWNSIPYVTENITYASGNYHIPNDSSWTPIEEDFTYAIDHLPVTQPNVGRVNKYAAEAFLAKAYMFEHKFTQALPLLNDLINNGVTSFGHRYTLVPHFGDNFDPATKNGDESVFAAQMSVNDGSQGANGNFGDVLNFPMAITNGCCSFFQPSQYLVNHFKTDPGTGLPDLDHFNDVDVPNDEGLQPGDPFTPYGGTLDPRLDLTVGRRGIPYLDWGPETGSDWVRDQATYGPYAPRKYVYKQVEQRQYSDNAFWSSGASATNIIFIRYADILLWAAEAEIEIPGGDLEKARSYVNQVRLRSKDSTGWVHTYIDPNNPTDGFTDTPAANYKIGLYTQPWTDPEFARKAVRFERMLEFGMEGERFFDLVRWGIATTEITAYLNKEKIKRTYLNAATFTACKSYFAIPEKELDLSAGANGVRQMIQNPCY